VVTGTVISSSAFNALTADLATGLSTAITKDGQTATTVRIPFAQGINSSLATDTSSGSTGSIYTAGGVGITKGLFVGGTATFSATPVFSALTASSAVATDASKNLVSVNNTGTGNNVLATSPTITTPTISQLTSAAATALTLQSAGTTAVTVDTSQNVGIGTASPSTYANGFGPVLVTGTGNNFATIQGRTDGPSGLTNGVAYGGSYSTNPINGSRVTFNAEGGSGQRGSVSFWTKALDDNSTQPLERMRVDQSGVVTMNAYGAGAATFSAAGVISSVSDETWKIKDGVPVDTDSMLKKLEPGYWYYNDEKKDTFGADRQLGFYAQNVNSAIGPEAAPTPEEGKPWGYYDRSVLAVTVISLQKALATIESLTTRIAALEA
jgi:hypothetical protein